MLLLGWESVPAVQKDNNLKAASYALAKALGSRVDLSMILPVAGAEFSIQNVTLEGLNNIDVPAASTRPTKDFQPFAQGDYIRPDISLYGAPLHSAENQELSGVHQAGQAASAGVFRKSEDHAAGDMGSTNIFGAQHLSQMSLDAQVIQYARWATRLAATREFDVIYAYDWRTFLAGSELKLVSGKPLVLQVHSLSQDRKGPGSDGWMYQLEKQALQKADCIIADSDKLAAAMTEEYLISPKVINSLEEKKVKPVPVTCLKPLPVIKVKPFGARSTFQKQKPAMPKEPKENWEGMADKIREILQHVAV